MSKKTPCEEPQCDNEALARFTFDLEEFPVSEGIRGGDWTEESPNLCEGCIKECLDAGLGSLTNFDTLKEASR